MIPAGVPARHHESLPGLGLVLLDLFWKCFPAVPTDFEHIKLCGQNTNSGLRSITLLSITHHKPSIYVLNVFQCQ